MGCISIDLTIDGALSDPMIAAAMRADKVDPRRLETLLRSTARTLDETRPAKPLPFAHLAERVRSACAGASSQW